MAQGKQQLKSDRNPWISFRDNCEADGRAMGEFRFHQLCWHGQAELKIQKSAFVKAVDANMQEVFEIIRKRYVGREQLGFSPPYGPMLTKK